MKYKKIVFTVLFVVVLLQLFVPFKMILKHEYVLQNGKLFKFKTAPIDPNDPFRGKYIRLNFDDTVSIYQSDKEWDRHEKVFVELDTDKDGFAIIKNVSRQKPNNTDAYIKADAYLNSIPYNNNIRINYPFDRFYMEETKAKPAENMYRQPVRRTTKKPAYALVAVKNGIGVIKDVKIDGVSIKKIANRQ